MAGLLDELLLAHLVRARMANFTGHISTDLLGHIDADFTWHWGTLATGNLGALLLGAKRARLLGQIVALLNLLAGVGGDVPAVFFGLLDALLPGN